MCCYRRSLLPRLSEPLQITQRLSNQLTRNEAPDVSVAFVVLAAEKLCQALGCHVLLRVRITADLGYFPSSSFALLPPSLFTIEAAVASLPGCRSK